MAANIPDKIYVEITHPISEEYTELVASESGEGIEYIRKDALSEPASEDLEEEIGNWLEEGLPNEGELIEHIKETARHFANWQKQKMMKGAVDGWLSSTVTGSEQIVSAYAGFGELGKDGDKVKLIIVK